MTKEHSDMRPLFKSYEMLISVLVGFVILGLQWAGALERFELSTLDMRFLLRGPITPDPRVVYVEMAEDSIENIGRWPWSRDWHATFVSVVDQYDPAAIIFDVIFTEPSDEEADDAFAAGIEAAGNVYLPMLEESVGEAISKRLYPIEKFRNYIRGTGHIRMFPDIDGVVRRIPLYLERDGELIPQVSFQAVLDYLGIAEQDVERIPGKWIILHRDGAHAIRIPIDENDQMILNWAGRWVDAFSHVSFFETLLAYKQTLQGEEQPVMDLSEYRGKIALIGLTAKGLFDTKPIPFESLHPMVGMHGNLISNILQENFLRTIPPWINWVATILFAVMVGCFIHWLGPLYSAVVSVLLLLLGAAGAYFAFTSHGLIVEIIAPSFAVVFSYLIITLYRYMTEEKKKRWIKMAFSHYLSPVVIEQIIKNPDQLKLGGERHVITVLFSDIRSFTTFSEKHTSEEVVNILNEYLDAMTKVILNNKGTIDKFVGDEIMALFGAPARMEVRQQAYLAVKTSLEMVDRLKTLHGKWKEEGKPLLGMGVGINTGEMICGNMGSSGIFDYTVIGDNVNIGARVEALTRKYECDIIITEATYEYVKDRIDAQKLDSIVVKGKTKPIQIYSVTGLKASAENPIVIAK